MIFKSLTSFELYKKYPCFSLSFISLKIVYIQMIWNYYGKFVMILCMISKGRDWESKCLMIMVWHDIGDLQALVGRYQNMNALMKDSMINVVKNILIGHKDKCIVSPRRFIPRYQCLKLCFLTWGSLVLKNKWLLYACFT